MHAAREWLWVWLSFVTPSLPESIVGSGNMHEWARVFLRAGLINDVCDWSSLGVYHWTGIWNEWWNGKWNGTVDM